MATQQVSTYKQEVLPFYGDITSRNGLTNGNLVDQVFYNVFPESMLNQVSQQKLMKIRKRPGLQLMEALTSTNTRGTLSFQNRSFVAIDNAVYENISGTLSFMFNLSNSSGHVGMVIWYFNGDDTEYLVAADGTTAYRWNMATNAYAGELPTGYPTPHLPYPLSIDGYLILAKAGTADVYSCQLEDLTAAWDFLTAELYPDNLVSLSRYNNYIAALGTNSIEFMYDAANTDGSPFSRNDSFVCPIGCISPEATVQVDQRLIWVGTTQEGGRSIWMMSDTKPTEISTTIIKEAMEGIADMSFCRAFTCRSLGHQWYVLNLTNGQTWAFDMKEALWALWVTPNIEGFPQYATDSGDGQSFMYTPKGIYRFNPNAFLDTGTPFTCLWQTNMLDFGNMNRKFCHRLVLTSEWPRGTTIADTLQVQWSDDDYGSWSDAVIVDLDTVRPSVVNLGHFRRRAFRFSIQNNGPLGVYSFELTYNQGSN